MSGIESIFFLFISLIKFFPLFRLLGISRDIAVCSVECNLHGVRMPELRSGVRRSKRLDDLQPSPKQVAQADNWLLSTQNKTRRRVGGGRGRGGNAVVKGPLQAIPPRQTAAGIGHGIKIIDLDPEHRKVLPEAAGLVAVGPAFNCIEVVADKDIAMEGGGSAEKIIGAEDEASATPVPEKVSLSALASML